QFGRGYAYGLVRQAEILGVDWNVLRKRQIFPGGTGEHFSLGLSVRSSSADGGGTPGDKRAGLHRQGWERRAE
ncbi:MAG: hypothetical protein J6Q14_08550, partial [Oscillospiraceae bacterium]|nr:hypothetical protein [Oscillospiraceae bacterium]